MKQVLAGICRAWVAQSEFAGQHAKNRVRPAHIFSIPAKSLVTACPPPAAAGLFMAAAQAQECAFDFQ